MKHLLYIPSILLAVALTMCPALAADKPNILVIWGDDIGQFNVSAYNMGVMGYKTPNIDRIARQPSSVSRTTRARLKEQRSLASDEESLPENRDRGDHGMGISTDVNKRLDPNVGDLEADLFRAGIADTCHPGEVLPSIIILNRIDRRSAAIAITKGTARP